MELFRKLALFTNSRIDPFSVPKGFYCYELRGSDQYSGKPMTLENQVFVNHAGTILTPEPVTIPKGGFHQLSGQLNFLGECLSFADFCKEIAA